MDAYIIKKVKVSYKPLWKILLARGMTKTELRK